MKTPVSITYFTSTFSGANVSTQLLTYKAASLCNSLAWPTWLHANYRLVAGQSPWARAWIAQPIGCTTRSVDDTKATLQ